MKASFARASVTLGLCVLVGLCSRAGAGTLIDPAAYKGFCSFRPPLGVQIEVIRRPLLPGLDMWHTHKIEQARGSLNLDRYPILINKPPKVNGQELGPQAFLNYVRLHLGDFLDPAIAKFHAAGFEDQNKWESNSPLGTVMQFDISPAPGAPGLEKGCVVMSEHAPDHWIFSTVYASEKGVEGHPVSGNRWFGVEVETGPLKGYTFSTKAADRPSSFVDQAAEDQIFAGAHNLWLGLLIRVKTFVETNGGTAILGMQEVQSQRFPWATVKGMVHAPTTGWVDMEGRWESNDANKRFRIESQELTGKFSLIERAAGGTELSVDAAPKMVFSGGVVTWTLERANTDPQVLTHLGFAPAIQAEILKRNPNPSFLTLVRSGDKLAGKWSGLSVIKDAAGKFKEMKQPGETPAKDYEFMLKP